MKGGVVFAIKAILQHHVYIQGYDLMCPSRIPEGHSWKLVELLEARTLWEVPRLTGSMSSEGSVAFYTLPVSGSRCLHFLILAYLRTICREVLQTRRGAHQALYKAIRTFSLLSSELNK